MKLSKIIASAVIASLTLSSPAMAEGYRHYRNYPHHEGGRWVLPALAGAIIGGILVESSRPAPAPEPRVVVVPPQNPTYININGRYYYYDQRCDCYR